MQMRKFARTSVLAASFFELAYSVANVCIYAFAVKNASVVSFHSTLANRYGIIFSWIFVGLILCRPFFSLAAVYFSIIGLIPRAISLLATILCISFSFFGFLTLITRGLVSPFQFVGATMSLVAIVTLVLVRKATPLIWPAIMIGIVSIYQLAVGAYLLIHFF